MSGPEKSDDARLLEDLGVTAREQEDGLPALADLEALARGERAADDPAFGSDDPGTAALLAALAGDPGPSAHERSAMAALEAFALPDDGAPVEPFDAEAAAQAAKEAAPQAEAEADNVVRLPVWRRRAWIAGPLLVAAAALLFFVVLPGGVERLPDYTAQVTGGQSLARGPDEPPDSPPVLGPDDQLKIVLTPFTAMQGEVAAVGWVMPEKGEPRPWSPPVEISADGAVRIVGTGSALGLAPNGDLEPVTLRVVIGRPAALPDTAHIKGLGGHGWQRFDIRVQLAR